MTPNVLRIISSPRGAASLTFQLGNAITEQIKAKYPGAAVKERNVHQDQLPHLDSVLISSFFTPAADMSAEQTAAIKYSDEAIRELQDADIIVLDTPMYNFTITSTLKTYLDHIVRSGVTFRVSENGIEGMLKNKKVYLAFAGSGVYSEGGSEQAYDFAVPLIKGIFGWLGMTDISTYRVEGLKKANVAPEVLLQSAIDSIVID